MFPRGKYTNCDFLCWPLVASDWTNEQEEGRKGVRLSFCEKGKIPNTRLKRKIHFEIV